MGLTLIGGGGSQIEYNPNIFPSGDINGWNTLFKFVKPIAANSEGRMLITVRLGGMTLTDGVDYVAFNNPDYEGGPIVGHINFVGGRIPQEGELNLVSDFYSPM